MRLSATVTSESVLTTGHTAVLEVTCVVCVYVFNFLRSTYKKIKQFERELHATSKMYPENITNNKDLAFCSSCEKIVTK